MATGRVPTTANSPLTAKGDLFGYSTTQARVPVGNDGETIVADSSTSTGLRYQADYAAGKNAIINGAFNVWQRGTSFSNPNGVYTTDRFLISNSTAVPTSTASQQTFTPGTAPVAGYESQFFFRFQVTSQGSSTGQAINTRLEDVRLFAGRTVTFSFYAKADASRTIGDIRIGQNFGSGGSGAVETAVTLNSTALTTSWARYTGTATIPSISGKTVGTSSYLYISVTAPFVAAYTLDTWGWQLEAGSVATAFQTATGTLQGELAACQRYYQRFNDGGGSVTGFANGMASSTTAAYFILNLITTMRVKPTTLDISSIRAADYNTAYSPSGAFSIYSGGTSAEKVSLTASTFTGLTQYRAYVLEAAGSTAAFIGIGAEL